MPTNSQHFISEIKSFDELGFDELEQWSVMAEANHKSAPFIGKNWLKPWIENFAPETKFFLLKENNELKGIIPFILTSETFAGRKIKTAVSTTNQQSPHYDFLALENNQEHFLALWNAFLSEENFDIVMLHRLSEDSLTISSAIETAKMQRLNMVLIECYRSPFRKLPTKEQGWETDLKPKFKSNLRNRMKRLSQIGQVSFEITDSREQLFAGMESFYQLEASGWKKDAGGAILLDKKTKKFYDEFISNSSAQMSLAFLRVDGKDIASHLLYFHNQRLFLVKIAYDPQYSKYSPGQLLTAKVMEDVVSKGFEVFDFLGIEMTWKRDWTTDNYQNYILVVCKNNFNGKFAYWTRYGMKETLKKSKSLVKFVRAIKKKMNKE